MKWLFPSLGWLMFLAGAVYFIAGYNTRWTVGRYFMPATLVTEEGCHPDGFPVDPLTQALVRSDMEEEAELTALFVLAALLGVLFKDMAELHRMQMRHLELMEEFRSRTTEPRQ